MSLPAWLRVRWWQDRLYPTPASRDPVRAFVEDLNALVKPEHVVLDVGAGAGHLNSYALKGKCKRIVGIDLDPRVATNPLLDEGVVADAGAPKFAAEMFDVIFSIYVLEHVEKPDEFAAEMARILKPGGVLMILTPNRFHYVPLISALTPSRFHKWLNSLRGRAHADTFPTFYRMNSRSSLKRVMEAHGMKVERFKMLEVQPNYLLFSLPTFWCGAVYERVVRSTDALAGIRVNIIGTFRK